MISKKEKMIVKAINKSKGYPVDIESFHHYQNVAKVKGSNVDFPKGEIHAVNDSYSYEAWEFICTVEEFKQCVKEMSEAKWMQKPIEDLMLSARESDKTVNFQYHHFIKNDVSEFPFEEDDKTDAREEAEIKAAKEKQVNDLVLAHSHFIEINNIRKPLVLRGLIKKMQDNGDLAEILLPLEK